MKVKEIGEASLSEVFTFLAIVACLIAIFVPGNDPFGETALLFFILSVVL